MHCEVENLRGLLLVLDFAKAVDAIIVLLRLTEIFKRVSC